MIDPFSDEKVRRIGQVLFFESDEACENTYGAGKYQDQQKEITLPRL